MQINLSMRAIDTTLVLGRTLNFRQAAGQLHLSQSALSTQIQRIEDALGVRLFDRTTRTVRLTAAGEVFLQQAATLQARQRGDNQQQPARCMLIGTPAGARGQQKGA